jgi:uncharacterized protein YqjF (DUF2071 family)
MSGICTGLRQGRVLAERAHRPWQVPQRRWFMAQTWRHLLFAHWRVAPDALARLIPTQIPLDLRDGAAWIAVTPFRVEGFRLRGTPPLPFVSRFPEVNVRTYVTVEEKPGIYFFSLDAGSSLAVAAARRTYRLPYFRSRMSLIESEGEFHMRSTRVTPEGPSAELDCSYAPIGGELPRREGSLARWLAERYCLYTLDDRGAVQRGEIHHPPWPLQPARAEIELNTMAAGIGLSLEEEPLLHYSGRQDVVLWTIEPA